MEKTPIYKKWWFYLIIILVLGGIGRVLGGDSNGTVNNRTSVGENASGALDSGSKSDTLYTIGKPTIGKTKMSITVEKMEETTDTGNDFLTLEDGKKLVVFDVLLKNESDKELSYNQQMYFKAKSTDGNEGQFKLVTTDGILQAGALSPGDIVRGKVVFEFPKDAKIKTLTLTDALFSKDVELKFV